MVTAILKALALKGIWAWRANSGTQVLSATSKVKRRVIKGAPAGTPDILLVLPHGMIADDFDQKLVLVGALCGLEVKSATGPQRPSQRAWQRRAVANGVRYEVVRSVKQAIAVVEVWRDG